MSDRSRFSRVLEMSKQLLKNISCLLQRILTDPDPPLEEYLFVRSEDFSCCLMVKSFFDLEPKGNHDINHYSHIKKCF